MTCPIGVPGIAGKEPATIAIAVAAELLQVRRTAREPNVASASLPRRADETCRVKPSADAAARSCTGITKIYPSVVANEDVDLTVMPGEIHAVLGENGAGKSTLMKIIYGVVKPDAGEMRWEGQPVVVANPAHARELGIGMVFQHFSLFETLTVVENVALALPGKPDLDGARRGASRGVREVRPAGRSAPPRALAVGRRAAARRDHPLPAADAEAPDHGRADVGADAAGGAQALRDAAPARRRGLQHPLHQPQAGRDPGALPHGDRAARRQGDRPLRAVAGDAEVDGADDDRQGLAGAAARRARRRAGRCGSSSRDSRMPPTIRSAPTSRTSDLDVHAGEIVGIAGVSGNGQQELLYALSGEEPLAEKFPVQHLRLRSRAHGAGAPAPARPVLRARGAAGPRRGAVDVARRQRAPDRRARRAASCGGR